MAALLPVFDFISFCQAILLAIAGLFLGLALSAWFTTTEPGITNADVEWRAYQSCGFGLAAFFFLVLFRLSFSCV